MELAWLAVEIVILAVGFVLHDIRCPDPVAVWPVHRHQGEIGKYIVTARKKGNDWYVGGQSNWDERTLTLKFDFLADGDYEAIVLKDGINANHDAEDYKIEKSVINQKSEMKIHLASGGGFVIKVIKK